MGFETTTYQDSEAVRITTDAIDLAAVTCCGPRICHLSLPGHENLLLWAPGQYGRGDWDLKGGHRVWATRPGADENEDTYTPDNEPCEVQIDGNSVLITGAASTLNGTRRGMQITAFDDGYVEVDNFIINDGPMLYSAGVWALTCTLPGEDAEYAVPIGDGSSWDAFTLVSFREWAGHGQGGFADDQIRITDDLVRLAPRGIENKRALQSHAGIIAMASPKRNVTFAKKAEFDPAGQYPLNTNIAFYIGPDNFMVEMETMGPECSLKPGQELHHVETWVLKNTSAALDNADAVKTLF